MIRAFPARRRLATFVAALALTATIGAQASAELVPPAAVAELEAALRALIAPRDLARADAAASALKAARIGLGSAEKRLAAFWQLWFAAGSNFEGDFDRAAFKAAYEAVRAAEASALASASAFLAEAKKARAYPERSKRLLSAYEAAIVMDPSWRVPEGDMAAFKQATVDGLLAAALGPGLAAYLAATRGPPGGAVGGHEALADFAEAWVSETEEGLMRAAFGVAQSYGPPARFISHSYLRGDALGYLAAGLSLMRDFDFIGLARSSGLGEAGLRTIAAAAAPASAPAARAPGGDELELALGLYAAWLSASLRAQSEEPAAFARLSAAYGADEALRPMLGPDGSAAAARLSARRDGYWLRAEEALAIDLRAELLAWLRSIGYAATTPRLGLKVRSRPLPGATLGAAVDIELLVDGARYYPPYGSLKPSIEASLRTVFGGELPAFAYVERVDASAYAYRGLSDHALRAELLDRGLGDSTEAAGSAGAAAVESEQGNDAAFYIPTWRLSAWMATRLGEPAVAALARSYGSAVAAAARMERLR